MPGESVFDRLYNHATISSSSKSRRMTAVKTTYKSSSPIRQVSGNKEKSKLSSPSFSTTSSSLSSLSASPSPSKKVVTRNKDGGLNSGKSKAISNRAAAAAATTTTTTAKSTSATAQRGKKVDLSKEVTRYTGPWKLTCTSRYDTSTPKRISGLSISGMDSLLHDYELGLLDEQAVANRLITALFDRDFMPGKHWDIDPSSVSRLADGSDSNGAGESDDSADESAVIRFQAEKEATWDWKDIYSVASAKGKICFYQQRKEIRVENYSYYVAG